MQHVAVITGSPFGGQTGSNALHLTAVFKIIMRRLAVMRQKRGDRIGKDLADDVADKGAVALPAMQDAAGNQGFDRLANDRPRYAHFSRQFPLTRQLVARPQNPFQNEALDLVRHLVGGAVMADLLKYRHVLFLTERYKDCQNWSIILTNAGSIFSR